MGSIYSTSVHTVTYLGSSSPEIDTAFEQINEVTSNETYYQADFVQHLMLDQPEILITAAKQLISRPWFTRIWILQELVLARDPGSNVAPREFDGIFSLFIFFRQKAFSAKSFCRPSRYQMKSSRIRSRSRRTIYMAIFSSESK
jgi:hypothetical protein